MPKPKIVKVTTAKLKLAKRTPGPVNLVAKEVSTPLSEEVSAAKIKASHTKALLIGFAIRTAIDARQSKRLTPMQGVVFRFLEDQGFTGNLLRRYQELPKGTQRALLGDFATLKPDVIDQHLVDGFVAMGNAVSTELKKAKAELRLETAFAPLTTSQASLKAIQDAAAARQAAQTTDVFDFSISYWGITTHKARDRAWTGVEPYLVPSFYHVAVDGGLEPYRPPFVIKHHPTPLHDMADDEWSPSGGNVAGAGIPINPKLVFTGAFPPLAQNDLYFAIVKVMEEDGDQSARIALGTGEALFALAGTLISAGGAAAAIPGAQGAALALVIAGLIIAAVALVSELISLCTAAGDDHIGDVLAAFSAEQICCGQHLLWAPRVAHGSNDWTLYFGVDSVKH